MDPPLKLPGITPPKGNGCVDGGGGPLPPGTTKPGPVSNGPPINAGGGIAPKWPLPIGDGMGEDIGGAILGGDMDESARRAPDAMSAVSCDIKEA